MTRYAILIDGKAGAYGVSFPDLPGCVAMGRTMDAALVNAAEALRDWIEFTEESATPVPSPRSVEALRKDREVARALKQGAALASVPLIRESGRPVKANLSLDSGILKAIDAEAKRRKLTRSSLVEAIAREALVDS